MNTSNSYNIKPNISVIIPCYNTNPVFIKEALKSVQKSYGIQQHEIIIVDDGSTDHLTIQFLKELNEQNINVFFETNKGPAAARNFGVKNSSAKYILFLDSDDRLLPEYIEKSISWLSAHKEYGVVYGKAKNFGDSSRNGIEAKPFNAAELLINNQVSMCSVIKREVWESVGGLDEKLKQFEDWEFWVHAYKAGWKFYFIDDFVFEYRISSASFYSSVDDAFYKETLGYIYQKHWKLVHELYYSLYAKSIMYDKDIQRPLRSFFKYVKKKISL